jgi:sugar-specific transcriptional regulator TrmB
LGLSSKTEIIREARVAPSKIYHLLDKLLDKGLASTIIKENVRTYAAAPLESIQHYLADKKAAIEQQEQEARKIIKELTRLQEKSREKVTAEVFIGWRGLDTMYSYIIEQLGPNQEGFILGASAGTNTEKTREFFVRKGIHSKVKRPRIKIIFDVITKGITAIVILKEEPVSVLIHDKETAESFTTYFKELWKLAKP